MKIKSQVYCTVQIEGIHNWGDCPLDEVSYLQSPHRHMFHITAGVDVLHHDRDVEFIVLKHQVKDYLDNKYKDEQLKVAVFGHMSCEMIARELIEQLNLSFCQVSEDGENGAILTREYE